LDPSISSPKKKKKVGPEDHILPIKAGLLSFSFRLTCFLLVLALK